MTKATPCSSCGTADMTLGDGPGGTRGNGFPRPEKSMEPSMWEGDTFNTAEEHWRQVPLRELAEAARLKSQTLNPRLPGCQLPAWTRGSRTALPS